MIGTGKNVSRGDEDEAEDHLETRSRRPSSPRSSDVQAPEAKPPGPTERSQPAIRPWMPAPEGDTTAPPPGNPSEATGSPLSRPRRTERASAGSDSAAGAGLSRAAASGGRASSRDSEDYPRSYGVAAGGGGAGDYDSQPARSVAVEPRYPGEPEPYYAAEGYSREVPGQRRSSGNACIWLAGLLAVIVISCGLLVYGGLQSGFSGLGGWVPQVPGLPLITPTTIISVDRPSVIQQIRPLGRLESVQYTIEKVIPGEATGPLPPLTSDKILFVAHGQVIAGVDLGKMTDGDVQVVSDSVSITLPAAEILVSRLDNDKSYVYDRDTGFFTKSDPNLESSVRRIAESEIVKAALEDGILLTAQRNAEETLRTLILALGYEQVTFRTRGAPASPTARP